jgi:glycosyltransferase involved in cell wall biosynthesis
MVSKPRTPVIEVAASVIVPSYQSEQTIRSCLGALLAQDFQPTYEIIVVDSSVDSTPEIIRKDFPEVRLIHLAQRTDPAAARNMGARIARGDILAFIDSDCIAEQDWLWRLTYDLNNGFSASGGSIRNANGDNPVSWAGYFCEFREFLPTGKKREVRNLTLGNAAYTKESFWKAGGFPEGCFPQEDQVFHHTFVKIGRIVYDPMTAIWHTHRSEENHFLNHQMYIGKANAGVVHRLGLPGKVLVRFPFLARLTIPAVAAFRFIRTILICWKIEQFIILKMPRTIFLCAKGMAWWGKGFIQGVDAIHKTGSSEHAISNS